MAQELIGTIRFLMMVRVSLKLEQDHIGEKTTVIPRMLRAWGFIVSCFSDRSTKTVMFNVIHGFQKKDSNQRLTEKEYKSAQTIMRGH